MVVEVDNRVDEVERVGVLHVVVREVHGVAGVHGVVNEVEDGGINDNAK